MTHDPQGDLFAAAEAAKQEGMQRVELHADPGWSAAMEFFALETCKRRAYFTSDDVYDLAARAGLALTTHDERAFGPVMLRIAKAGACRKANCAPVKSRRRSLHASPRAVWQSLIYRPVPHAGHSHAATHAAPATPPPPHHATTPTQTEAHHPMRPAPIGQ